MTAHELGHVIIHEDNKLKKLMEWIIRRCQREKIQRQLPELLLSCSPPTSWDLPCTRSVVLLKLDPMKAYQDRGDQPADDKRAKVIFSMLEWMDEREELRIPARAPSRNFVIVGRAWSKGRVRCPDRDTPVRGQVSELVELAKKEFAENLPVIAEYPMTGADNGLPMAIKWSNQWQGELGKDSLTITEVTGNSQIRDVFNAAWLCRLEVDGDGIISNRSRRHLTNCGQRSQAKGIRPRHLFQDFDQQEDKRDSVWNQKPHRGPVVQVPLDNNRKELGTDLQK